MAKFWDVCSSVFLAALLIGVCESRIHHLALKNDTRFVIHLSTFGFYANGTLDVNLQALTLRKDKNIDFTQYPMGFSLSKSRVNILLAYTAEDTEKCLLSKTTSEQPLILFLLDFQKHRVNVRSFSEKDTVLSGVLTSKEDDPKVPTKKETRDISKQSPVSERNMTTAAKSSGPPSSQIKTTEAKTTKTTKGATNKETAGQKESAPEGKSVKKNLASSVTTIDGTTLVLQEIENSYNFSFHLKIGSLDEGLYNLNFHNCYNKQPAVGEPYDLRVEIIERNPGGYLSAAEIPLPRLFISMAIIFFIAAVAWVSTLMKHRYSVFKIHWLMAALAFTKSVSLVFHSINYHFINEEGHPIEGWAVMYYITHLLKGALLFITLALIGTGWAFVKYILSDKEKKIFMIVIPLQVLANVAYIIIESTEEGSSDYALWKEVLFLVDLICCGAILFPVVWSIRHLRDASSTDGKAAMNLEKLKLFRHYYVMIVCYIYFTRIIAFLLKVAIPFQWQWFYELLVEVSTLIFFVMTGYTFRPASNNPYLQLPQDEEDVEMDEVVTESGALEGISRVKKTQNGRERPREPAP
ncbi:hypothetical protein GJAV_G00146030 [Gymnothorax javanicus]|nr:hypothetical protein GJAV_G00146030 [Gymnothorax javanicus]